ADSDGFCQLASCIYSIFWNEHARTKAILDVGHATFGHELLGRTHGHVEGSVPYEKITRSISLTVGRRVALVADHQIGEAEGKLRTDQVLGHCTGSVSSAFFGS